MDKRVVLWLVLSGITFIAFLLLFTVFLEFKYTGCFATAFGTIVVSYLLLWASEKISFGSDEWYEATEEEKTVNEETKGKVNLGKEGKRKKSSFLDKLKRKKTCDNCGTELEYREEVESYYCPECHEYK